MSYKLYGDVPKEHLELVEELLEMEEYFDTEHLKYPPSLLARAYVSLACDWYTIISEDTKGGSLLEKAEKVCPGYFKNEIVDDIQEDPEFAILVENLTDSLLIIAQSIIDSKLCK